LIWTRRDVDVGDLIVVNDGPTEAARAPQHPQGPARGRAWSRWFYRWPMVGWGEHRHPRNMSRVDRGYLRVSDDGVVVYATTDCPICRIPPHRPGWPPGAHNRPTRSISRVRDMTITG
jgi:hypothetical protein